jgi:SAM-dependent methyltransferase
LSAYDTSGENWVEHRPDTRRVIEELDAVGTGCVLIARRVLEHAAMRAPFARAFDVDGLSVQGSDLLFCRRAQAVGFRIFADYSRPCSHLKTVDLVEVNQALGQRDVSQVLVENPNSKRYWDNQWSTRGSRELPFYAELAERLRGKRVLDYGCGRGDLLALLGEHACGYDQSSVAVQICRDRGLAAYSSEDFDSDPLSELGTIWDAIVSTEVLEHLDSDEELLRQFFRWTNDVWYSVPNNCLPPGLEPEHRRVYTHEYIERITPYLRSVKEVGIWLLVHARK